MCLPLSIKLAFIAPVENYGDPQKQERESGESLYM